jgi:hypothetical protein
LDCSSFAIAFMLRTVQSDRPWACWWGEQIFIYYTSYCGLTQLHGWRVLYVLAVFPSLTGTIVCAGHSRREGGESSGVRPHCGFPMLSCHWGVSCLL